VALQDKPTLTRDEKAKIIGQTTTNWDFNVAKNLAEANLTAATAADKGTVYILAPNDGTVRSIADPFTTDEDVMKYFVTGQDAEKASVQYIIDGKQSMTMLKDVRTLAADAIAAANAYLSGGTPEKTNTYNNGKIDVPAKPSPFSQTPSRLTLAKAQGGTCQCLHESFARARNNTLLASFGGRGL
jgi:putative multiple sugar transport system substrate-binding protein